jgi:hypothetical protein
MTSHSPLQMAALDSAIHCCAWLVRRGYIGLALDMRSDYVREHYIDAKAWNAALDTTIDFVPQYERLRIGDQAF